MLAAVDSFQLTEEAIIFPILPPSLAVLGLLVILVDVLKLLLAFLSVPTVPQLGQLPEKIIINKAGRQAVQSVFSGNPTESPINPSERKPHYHPVLRMATHSFHDKH